MKDTVCSHCGAVNSHPSFKCFNKKKTIIERAAEAIEEMDMAHLKIRGHVNNLKSKFPNSQIISIERPTTGIPEVPVEDNSIKITIEQVNTHISVTKRVKERTANKRIQKPKKKSDNKSIRELKELAQIVVNRHVRKRDSLHDGTFKCMACQRWCTTKLMHAGHFISVGHQSTRYDLNNIWGCCVKCNTSLYGNLKKYRVNLINKIGIEAVEEMESRSKQIKKWTKEEILEIIKTYK